jgi:hypothetical protein
MQCIRSVGRSNVVSRRHGLTSAAPALSADLTSPRGSASARPRKPREREMNIYLTTVAASGADKLSCAAGHRIGALVARVGGH